MGVLVLGSVFQALHGGRLWHARWILVRDHLNLGLTVVAYVVASVGKRVLSIWKMIG